MSVLEDLAKEDQYELAIRVCEAAEASAQKAKGTALVRKLWDATAELHRGQERFDGYQQALAALEKEPADPAANYAAGWYRCLVKGDWERGAATLALGNEPAFKAAAVLDRRGSNVPDEQVAVGDAWWDLAEKNQGPERYALRIRGRFLVPEGRDESARRSGGAQGQTAS